VTNQEWNHFTIGQIWQEGVRSQSNNQTQWEPHYIVSSYHPLSKTTTSQISHAPSDAMVYCNPPALGRDSAHIIITPSLSNMYAWSLISSCGHTSSVFTPYYLQSVWVCLIPAYSLASLLPWLHEWVAHSPVIMNISTIHTRDCGKLWHIIRARYPIQKVGATQG